MDGDVVAVSDRPGDPVAVLVWEVEGVRVGEGDAVWDAEGVKEGVAVGVVLGAGLVLMDWRRRVRVPGWGCLSYSVMP